MKETVIELQAQVDILKYLEGSPYNSDEIIFMLEDRIKKLALKKPKFYRLRHKPTGLYYVPSRTIQVTLKNGDVMATKSNLSERGKVYTRKPTSSLTEGSYFYNHKVLEEKYYPAPKSQSYYSRSGLERFCSEPYKESDWEIIGYD